MEGFSAEPSGKRLDKKGSFASECWKCSTGASFKRSQQGSLVDALIF
jgi:hypothetical protein